MKNIVRAGGIAAAALAVVVFGAVGDPVQAWQGDFSPLAPRFLSHAAAQPGGFNLALDSIDDAADGDEAAMFESHALAKVEALAGAIDQAVPRPRALGEMVEKLARVETVDEQQECLANAVYFEARGESLEGQLAVADVVLNRTASKRYPNSICEVVVQPWQFSFIQRGQFPKANKGSAAWRKAVAIARISQDEASRIVSEDVLWYHADYVAPGWGKRLNRVTKVGLHIFYS
jgi:spore germination cell wall hydrolase CwlJ-like protein